MGTNAAEDMDNFYSRCLLCTCRPDVSPHLHISSEAANQLQLAKKINKYLNIQIDAELPQNVCHGCVEKLEVTHDLVTSSQQARITLLQIKQQIENFGQEDARTMMLDKSERPGTSITQTIPFKKGKMVERDYGGVVTCDICNEKVKHKFCLIQHKNQKHNMNLPFDCEHCGLRCLSLINIMQHVDKHTACDAGKKLFPKSSTKQHQLKLLDDDMFDPVHCGICNFTSRNKFSLLKHLNREHLDVVVEPLPFCCELCDKEFTSYSSLLRHLSEVHSPKMQCCHCNKLIANNKMNNHLKLHHKKLNSNVTEGSLVKTEPFEEVLISEFVAIAEHEIKQEPQDDHYDQMDCLPENVQSGDAECLLKCEHSGSRILMSYLLECETCCYSTDNKTELTTHMQAHQAPNKSGKTKRRRYTKKRKSRILMCAECGILYSYPEILAWHVDNCHGSDAIVNVVKINDTQHSYQCAICATVFKTLVFVMSHLRMQHRVSNFPFKCNACGKSFVRIEHFRKHGIKCEGAGSTKSKHDTNENGVKCKMCNKVFKSEIQLNNHISTFHALKIQSHKCGHCDETFRFFPRLKSHCLDRHPGKSIVQCELCEGHGFTSYHGYRLHKKSKHPTHV